MTGNGVSFAALLDFVLPGGSSRAQVKFFEGRADYRKIRDWKRGERWPADWAVERLQSAVASRIAFAETHKARLRPGPGLKGNRANLKPFRQAS